jgi:hypothetical protein
LSADPDTEANKVQGKFGNDTMQIALGMFFTLTSLFIISASTSSGDGHTGEGVSAHLIEKKEDLGYDPIQAGTKDPDSKEKQDGTGLKGSANETGK